MSVRTFRVLIMLGAACPVWRGIALAGPLNPAAGPVAPTPGPEPRISVNATNTPGDGSALFVISQPGSYYLAGNITGVAGKHGVKITAHGVTLDLNGFDLAGVAGMGAFDGVNVAGGSLRNISVRNGSVRDWGGDGVDLASAVNSRIESVRASVCAGRGVAIGSYGAVIDCHAFANTTYGIETGRGCEVRSCVATLNSSDGIRTNTECTVSDCRAMDNTRNGIFVFSGSIVSQCVASSNGQIGIETTVDSTVKGCTSNSNGYDGIRVDSNTIVADNLCVNNGTAGLFSGIFANGSRCRVEGNHVTTTSTNDGGISIAASGVGNVVIRNYVVGSGAINYTYPATGNFIGTIAPGSNPMNMAENANLNISY